MDTPVPLARRLRRLPRVTVLGIDVPVASSPGSRLLGLALLDRASAGAGLWIPRCRSVHTFGMRFALDLVFIDREGRVVHRSASVPTRRIVWCRAAAGVLELPTGAGA
jgi:uncharacterized membrane protein (UPF0127 family)